MKDGKPRIRGSTSPVLAMLEQSRIIQPVLFLGKLSGMAENVSGSYSFIAALNFVLDFDFIEQGANNNIPDYFEWYGGFALLVTVIWLYFEILRLLAQLSRRD